MPKKKGGFSMSKITVTIIDQTGNKRTDVTVPDDRPVRAIIQKLVEGMKLPATGPDGQPLSYKLHHKASGKQLREDQTFAQAGIKEGDLLRLQPEITAGWGHHA
jgi:uncharacterized ubiquitin-like protein YukD